MLHQSDFKSLANLQYTVKIDKLDFSRSRRGNTDRKRARRGGKGSGGGEAQGRGGGEKPPCAADSIARRGASVWREVEAEIELRNAKGYEKAAELLRDLRTIADERGGMEDFHARLSAIRERHSTKRTFIERLTDL